MSTELPGERERPEGITVSEAAARIGIAASTLRTWERRYALAPVGRSAGGHRRYAPADVARLRLVHRLVLAGEPPARAALLARRGQAMGTADPSAVPSTDASAIPSTDASAIPGTDAGTDASTDASTDPGATGARRAGPGGRVLALPGADRRARGLARAGLTLDVDQAAALIEESLLERGVVATWDALVRPVLAAAGTHWARTGQGIEVEHLLTEATVDALRTHRRRLPGPDPDLAPFVLACAPTDQHTLPLQALAAALREGGRSSRVLGARVPAPALAATVRRTGARGAFVWAQLSDGHAGEVLGLPSTRPPVRLVVGGPGWQGVDLPWGATLVHDLATALAALLAD